MSPRFVLGRENVPCVAEVVNRSLNADCTNFTSLCLHESLFSLLTDFFPSHPHLKFVYKLDINNHKTVSNEKDVNNLFN